MKNKLLRDFQFLKEKLSKTECTTLDGGKPSPIRYFINL